MRAPNRMRTTLVRSILMLPACQLLVASILLSSLFLPKLPSLVGDQAQLTARTVAAPATPLPAPAAQFRVNLPLVLRNASDPVLVGAGDIASCYAGNVSDEATAALLDTIPGTVFTAGDNAYPDGTLDQFRNCYGPTWGRHKARTHPATGNHEYHTAGATGYYTYFGAAAGDPNKGYYSYDLGAWHVIVLNSNCDFVACQAGSPQELWLRADLAARATACTLAYWHHPRFSSGFHGNDGDLQPFWQALYEAGADVVISAHSHGYERFALQTPDGQADAQYGIREFVVGTGGDKFEAMGKIQPNSEVRNNTTHGVLKLTLHSTSYNWSFIPIAGKTFTDVGQGACHAPPVHGQLSSKQFGEVQSHYYRYPD